MPELEDCILITGKEYLSLESPEFIGQTRLDENCMYYMVWKSDNILYKTYQHIWFFDF